MIPCDLIAVKCGDSGDFNRDGNRHYCLLPEERTSQSLPFVCNNYEGDSVKLETQSKLDDMREFNFMSCGLYVITYTN